MTIVIADFVCSVHGQHCYTFILLDALSSFFRFYLDVCVSYDISHAFHELTDLDVHGAQCTLHTLSLQMDMNCELSLYCIACAV